MSENERLEMLIDQKKEVVRLLVGRDMMSEALKVCGQIVEMEKLKEITQ